MKKQLKMFAASFLVMGALAVTPLAQSGGTEFCKLSLRGCYRPVAQPATGSHTNGILWLALLSALKVM